MNMSVLCRAHVQGFVPVPHDSAYQLLLDAHIGLGSGPEAWALLRFLGDAAWQPPDAAFLSLLATARGAELHDVPQAWRAFTLRGVLPSGVCCNCFITEAAASTTGSGVSPGKVVSVEYTCMASMHSSQLERPASVVLLCWAADLGFRDLPRLTGTWSVAKSRQIQAQT